MNGINENRKLDETKLFKKRVRLSPISYLPTYSKYDVIYKINGKNYNARVLAASTDDAKARINRHLGPDDRIHVISICKV